MTSALIFLLFAIGFIGSTALIAVMLGQRLSDVANALRGQSGTGQVGDFGPVVVRARAEHRHTRRIVSSGPSLAQLRRAAA